MAQYLALSFEINEINNNKQYHALTIVERSFGTCGIKTKLSITDV